MSILRFDNEAGLEILDTHAFTWDWLAFGYYRDVNCYVFSNTSFFSGIETNRAILICRKPFYFFHRSEYPTPLKFSTNTHSKRNFIVDLIPGHISRPDQYTVPFYNGEGDLFVVVICSALTLYMEAPDNANDANEVKD